MKYLYSIFFMFGVVLGFSQNEIHDSEYLNCGKFEATQNFFLQHPEEEAVANESNAQLEEFTRNFESASLRDDDLIIIPVVFHVIHYYGTENISNEQIYSAIDVMNADFTAQNQGANSVVSAFQSIVANVNFEFRLAKKDPDGNCTNGIIRTVHPETNIGGENLKTISPTWGRDKYLNIWVCRSIESGAAGYSMLPGNVNGPFGALVDGIVIAHNYVGSIGTSTPTRSHSLTHEVGHWANLEHTWGPGNQPGLPNNCSQDDGVLDTPNTIGWTTCNLNGISCESLDNVENFMEYSYYSKMFTNGQKNRMRAAMASNIAQRKLLYTSQNLAATGVLDDETVCKANFDAVGERVICEGGEVTFKDLSYNGVSSVTWSFPGGNPGTSSLASPVVTYDTPGEYEVTLTASNDISEKTVTKAKFVTVLPANEFQLPLNEGFENMTSFEINNKNWKVINPEGSSSEIEWKIHPSVGYQSSKSAYVKGHSNIIGEQEILMSPTFNLRELSQNDVLKFRYAHARRSPNTKDKLVVYISRNCGENWNQRLSLQGANLATVSNYMTGEFVPTSNSQWEEAVISNITSLFFTDEFRIKFEFTSERGNNIYIDKIELYDPAAVGLEEHEWVSYFDVFPNPAVNEVRVDYKLKNAANVQIQLYDIAGRLIKTIEEGNVASEKKETNFEVNHLASGVYFVRLVADSFYVSRKVVVQP